jgi:hypothetical protein
MDLNIDNYSYADLLNVLKISNKNSLENIDKMNNLLEDVKKKCSKEIALFFTKAYNIVSSIFNLQQINLIDSVENFELINDYYYKIKNIKNLEYKKVEQIVSFIKDLKKDTYATSYVKILQTDEHLSSNNNRSLYNNLHTNVVNDTLNNTIAPGNINSIKRITKVLNLHMNSCFRSNYFQSNASDFQYIIPSEIKNVVSMQLVSLEVPHSWYLISRKNKNNFFKIMVTMIQPKCIESNEYTIEIPEGNYTEKTLEKFLNKTYFYESDNENLLKYIRFFIDSYNKKTVFEILDSTVNISLFFSEETNENPLSTFGWLCGFRLTTYLNISESMFSEGIFDKVMESYVYIVINDYQYNTNHMNIVGFDKSVLNENVIAKALLKKNSPIILNNENLFTQIREYNGPVNISKLHIKLLNKFGELIDLNNMDIGLTIQFETLYESFNFKNISD